MNAAAPGTLAGLGLLLAGCSGPGSPRATSAAHAAEAFTAAAADRPGAVSGLLAPGMAHELADTSGPRLSGRFSETSAAIATDASPG